MKYLIITSCSKRKLENAASVKDLYQGQFFKKVRKLAEHMNCDLKVLSAKHGLLDSDDIIEPYELELKTKKQIRTLKIQVRPYLEKLFLEYDKILVITGKKYRDLIPKNDKLKCLECSGYGEYLSILNYMLSFTKKRLVEFLFL